MRISQLFLLASVTLISVSCATNGAHPPMKLVRITGEPTKDTLHARALNQQAAMLIAKSNFIGADKLLQQAIVADSEFGPAQNNLGVVYFNQAKPYQAAQQFLLAAALLPRDPQPRNGLGLVFESSGRFDDAIIYYDRARALDPANLEYIGNSARARVRRGDHTDELQAMLSNLATNDPREQWNQWARQTLAHMDHSPASVPTPVTKSSPGNERQ